jgi:cysteine desulfurase / selenocysteine lyase
MTLTADTTPLDVAAIRKDFPLLSEPRPDGRPLVYLDSASSAQKPRAVLDAMDDLYRTTYANVHRGVYQLGAETTDRYEGARRTVARFINAPSDRGVVFTKNVTEAMNLVANTWGRANLSAGDVVVLSDMEHHANIVPWLMLREQLGIELRWLGLTGDHHLDLTNLDEMVAGAKLVSVTAMSNVLLIVTSLVSPGTRCSDPPASACCGGVRISSRPCHRSSVVAR